MNDQLFETMLQLCMILDHEDYTYYQSVLAKNAEIEAKERGFTDWVDAYHNFVYIK